MSKYPLKVNSKTTTAVRKAESHPVELVTPARMFGGFFSFHYSYTEVSSQGGRTRVKGRQTRLEDGKLSTETFEGELDGGVYDEAVRQAQQQVLGQTAWLLRSLSWLLPPLRSTGSDRE